MPSCLWISAQAHAVRFRMCLEVPLYCHKYLYVLNTGVIDPATVPEVRTTMLEPHDELWKMSYLDGDR